MKNLFDGSDDELTAGQALVLIARNSSLPTYTEAEQRQLVRAIEKEYDLVPPDPEPRYADPKDRELVETNEELERARAEVAALRRQHQERADRDELDRLRAEREALSSGDGGDAPAQRERLWIDR